MFGYVLETIIKLIPFIPVTLFLAFSSMFLGLILGFILTLMKLSRNKVLAKIANIYTSIIRGTPTVILIFLTYYGLPMIFNTFGVDLSNVNRWIFNIIALTLYCSAILSEIMRPAYLSIDKGQMEASLSVGLTKVQALKEVVIPQALFIAIPNFGNMIIGLVHESSLAYLIGTVDIMGQANIIGASSYGANTVKIYIAVSIIYWIISFICGKLIDMFADHTGKALIKN